MKDFPILLLIIAYAVFTALRKKKKREAEAAKKRAEQQAAASVAAQPGEGAPIMQASSPTYPKQETAAPFDPFFGGLMEAITELASDKNPPAGKQPATAEVTSAPRAARKVGDPDMQPTRKAAPGTTLAPTFRHTLEASSMTGGHAHMESSMTGIEAECERPRASAAGVPAPAAAATAFQWSVADARRGVILSEIMGLPKALRR